VLAFAIIPDMKVAWIINLFSEHAENRLERRSLRLSGELADNWFSMSSLPFIEERLQAARPHRQHQPGGGPDPAAK
jgi:hypothetical protein